MNTEKRRQVPMCETVVEGPDVSEAQEHVNVLLIFI